MAAAKIDRTPSVEDRIQDMRKQSALLFLALDSFGEQDPSGTCGDYGELSREGFRGFAEIAQALYFDVLAVAAALVEDPPAGKDLSCPFVWPAPDATGDE